MKRTGSALFVLTDLIFQLSAARAEVTSSFIESELASTTVATALDLGRVAFGVGWTIEIWDTVNLKQITKLDISTEWGTERRLNAGVCSLAFSPASADRLAVGHSRGRIMIYEGSEIVVSTQLPYFMVWKGKWLNGPDPLPVSRLASMERLYPAYLSWSDEGNFLGVGYDDSTYIVVDARSGKIVFLRSGLFDGFPRQLSAQTEEEEEEIREALYGALSLLPVEPSVIVGKDWRPPLGTSLPSYSPVYLSEKQSSSIIQQYNAVAGQEDQAVVGISWLDAKTRWSLEIKDDDYAYWIHGSTKFAIVNRISRQVRIFEIDNPTEQPAVNCKLPSPHDDRDSGRTFFQLPDETIIVVELREGAKKFYEKSLVVSDLCVENPGSVPMLCCYSTAKKERPSPT